MMRGHSHLEKQEDLYVGIPVDATLIAVLETLPPEFGKCQQGSQSWSPDSKEITFACIDRYAIWIVHADGTDP
jgi:hypothetical protein